ncbi:signal peptidase I [Clostridium tyrobutyricum]|uniref:signal peptidase I n=1 Tax=Clostridium tyrobutyricum TaxID=1519 RepID=UPI0030CD72B0
MENKKLKKSITSYIVYIIVVIVIAVILQRFVFARATVTGPSMQPTFSNNDIIFLEKISTEIGHINRGEIVIFNSQDENNDNYIKRVIGVAGNKIEIKNSKVYLNGKELQEKYLPIGTKTEPNSSITTYTVPKGYIFVLGDNRENSTDSRILGNISLKQVKGHVVLGLYPFKNIKIF